MAAQSLADKTRRFLRNQGRHSRKAGIPFRWLQRKEYSRRHSRDPRKDAEQNHLFDTPVDDVFARKWERA